MRDFRDHGDRMFKPVQIIGGARTRAIVQQAMDMVNVNDQFIVPRILCRVKPGSLISTGLNIQIEGDQIFLVCDHGANAVWNMHLLLACDRQITWQRSNTVVDAVTQLPKAGGVVQTLGTPWVYWERPVRPPTDQTTRFANVDYVVATGAPIVQGDTVDGLTVIRHDISMGVTILGVRA